MTIPPSEPDQSPQPTPFMVFCGCCGYLGFIFPVLGLSLLGLYYLSVAVAPYRIHCNYNDPETDWRHGSWDVHSAESFLREETKKGTRCKREYPQQ